MDILDFNWQLTETFAQTTIDAAAAGFHLFDWLTTLNDDVSWQTQTNGRIQFQAVQPFCTLHPNPEAIACTIHHNGRTQVKTIASMADVNETLQAHLLNAYINAR